MDLRIVDPWSLARTLNACHLAALFFTKFGCYVPEGELRSELTAVLRTQRIYNDTLIRQLGEIRLALGEISQDPVVLKGPSLWGWLYANPEVRKTRDLDLLIVRPDDMPRAVESLRKLGFEGDVARIQVAMKARDHYELPPLWRQAVIDVSSDEDHSVNLLLTRYPTRHDFTQIGRRRYSVLIEVELHRSFFLYDDGSCVDLHESALTPFALVPGISRLTKSAQLPYLAAKFGLDTEGAGGSPPKPESLKLMADFIALLDLASDAEIVQSFQLARAWHCERYYGRMAATVMPMMQGLNFMNLDYTPYDPEVLLTMAFHNSAQPVS